MNNQKLIEKIFPIKEVGEESRKEKNIRHGHISTLHIWWARRPLSASRTVIYASLVNLPKNEEELKKEIEFIKQLANRNLFKFGDENEIIKKAKDKILGEFNGNPPKILDCFAGGGSIPLEAARLGCESYAVEYNPVAYLILLATLVYPQKYGKKLVKDIEKWGKWVYEEAKKELERFYPKKKLSNSGLLKYLDKNNDNENGLTPIGYIWVRTYKCPICKKETILAKQFWLAKKDNKKICYVPIVDKDKGEIRFKVVDMSKEEPKMIIIENGKTIEKEFDPSEGTVNRGNAKCLFCGNITKSERLKQIFKEGKAGEKLAIVILTKGRGEGKIYVPADEEDIKACEEAKRYLEEKVREFKEKWGINPLPKEKLTHDPRSIWVTLYGIDEYWKLFNPRQLLALVVFMDKIKEAEKKILEETNDEEYTKAVVTYLAFIFDKFIDANSKNATFNIETESLRRTFSRQALQMTWDYLETAIDIYYEGFQSIVDTVKNLINVKNPSKVYLGTALSLPFPDNYFDAIITDPPYYDNVPYADLSDFFYVWLKRILGDLYPDVFFEELTPKEEEIVANPVYGKDKTFFEQKMQEALKEIKRVLKDNGIIAIFYTHKSVEGWEALINALLKSEFVITAAWPIHTEREQRLRAQQSAALASSIVLIGRKIKKEEVGIFEEIKDEIKNEINSSVDLLMKNNITGADLMIALIGRALSTISRYKKIIDLEGKEYTISKLLEEVRKIIIESTVSKMLGTIVDKIDKPSLVYFAFRQNYGENVIDYDSLLKLCRVFDINPDTLLKLGLIKNVKSRKNYKFLTYKERSLNPDKLTGFYIDIIHVLLQRIAKGIEIEDILSTYPIDQEALMKYAQALYSILPEESNEKKMLHILLTQLQKITKAQRRLPFT